MSETRVLQSQRWPLGGGTCSVIIKATYEVTVRKRPLKTGIHSLALLRRPMSFSSLMASAMSPLMRSFPDMNAIVGFRFPKTQRPCYYGDQDLCRGGASATGLTGKHFAEVAGVHRHDDVGFDRRLAGAQAARAAFQVEKPDPCVVT